MLTKVPVQGRPSASYSSAQQYVFQGLHHHRPRVYQDSPNFWRFKGSGTSIQHETPLTGNPCSRWSLASEPLVPTYLCSPSQALATGVHHHTTDKLVCWFWVQTQAVVVTQQVLYWLSHLLSHLPRSSFWEAFAKSEFGTQVCCNSMRGRCNKKPAGLGKGGSWGLPVTTGGHQNLKGRESAVQKSKSADGTLNFRRKIKFSFHRWKQHCRILTTDSDFLQTSHQHVHE